MPQRAHYVAMQPEIRLQQVMVLGICFFIVYDLSFAITVWSPVVGWFMVTQGLVPRGR